MNRAAQIVIRIVVGLIAVLAFQFIVGLASRAVHYPLPSGMESLVWVALFLYLAYLIGQLIVG